MKLTNKSPDELLWADLGKHAYYHWQHMKSHLTEAFNMLCEKTTERVFETMSQEQKDRIVKKYVHDCIRNKNHYGEVAQLLIDSGNQNIVEEIGVTPKDFTASITTKLFPSWMLNLETGEYEPPIPYPADGIDYNWNEVTKQWVEIEKWGDQDSLKESEKLTWNQERNKRLDLCSTCEYNKNNWCSECGCIIALKTAAPWMSCPVGKWNSMWSDDEKQKYHYK